MSKKLITACMALGALAASALPGVASASPQITHPTGTRLNPIEKEEGGVKTFRKIKATNLGNVLFLNSSTVLSECSKVVITGELTKNAGTEIEGVITTATVEGTGEEVKGMHECKGPASMGGYTFTTNGGGVDGENVAGGTPWCIKANSSMEPDEFQIRGGLCSEASRKITFILDTTLANECAYERTAAIKGTFTTHATGDAQLTIPQANSGFTKESGGVICPSSTTLEMKVTLETDSATTEPLYIS